MRLYVEKEKKEAKKQKNSLENVCEYLFLLNVALCFLLFACFHYHENTIQVSFLCFLASFTIINT